MKTNDQPFAVTPPAAWGPPNSRGMGGRAGAWASLLLVVFVTTMALGQDPAHPLKPPDRSSPRATLKTFLEAGDALGTYMAQEYMESPSRAKFQRLIAMADVVVHSLDLSEVPPAARSKMSRAAALSLYGVLCRIELPPFEAIPGADPTNLSAGTNAIRWVIPNTEITLERVPNRTRGGEYLFSANTVARAGEFYERVRKLPYLRPVPLQNLKDLAATGGGWMIPHRWIKALPDFLLIPLAGQAGWKWIVLIFLLLVFGILLPLVCRLSHQGSAQHPFKQALAQSALPAFILLAMPVFAYLALVQLNLGGGVGSSIELTVTAVIFLAAAWISWRIAPVIAEAIIASPKIAPESIDAHLIRICTRLLGIIAGAVLLAIGADRLGLPLYGIIAGLGVGGLAIALAAQPTIENLIGGLSLFADKPIRVGDKCKYGTDVGTIETIGLRSTRIRGLDRTLTTVPNAVLSKMPIVNLTQRDRMVIHTVIGVRYETSPEQLRFLLAKLREMIFGHPHIDPETSRVRFIGFGTSTQDIELVAQVITRDLAEFLGIQEDVFLRVIDIVKESGTGFAFPSQTLYFARDDGLDTRRAEAAEAQVRQWREEGRLPFPNFTPEQLRQIQGTISYPPPGSPEASIKPPTRSSSG